MALVAMYIMHKVCSNECVTTEHTFDKKNVTKNTQYPSKLCFFLANSLYGNKNT